MLVITFITYCNPQVYERDKLALGHETKQLRLQQIKLNNAYHNNNEILSGFFFALTSFDRKHK